HQTVPQLHGQYEGDRSRKLELIEHGFRLPSAADNRPLRFEEVMERVNQVVFMSATPGPYELEVSSTVVEQIVRPTGLVDPEVIVRPTKGQIDDLIREINERIERDQRVLVTTLTKKMAEDLSDYLLEQGLRVRYLHSNIDTIERIEIVRALRLGEFDVLVGINLLREGLDLPEVSLVAILDADKEGFLRSETSLIQTIGRAARNVDGQVIMYADTITDSMRRAIGETQRRRQLQIAYNEEHGIQPQTIRKAVNDILAHLRPEEGAPVPGDGRRRRRGAGARLRDELTDLPPTELGRLIQTLEEEMHEAGVWPRPAVDPCEHPFLSAGDPIASCAVAESLVIRGAREHNLRNVNLELPRDRLIVFTGLSGSGKSSLAFDTIYAEGQRRYVESLSAYARQFLGQMDKPDVDFIEGLSPAISIDQKSASRNPRSTVGTITEVYDYLRLLYARIGVPHCPTCGAEVTRQTPQQIVDR